MAQKIRLSFYVYKDGVEVNHTTKAGFISPDENEELKAKEFLVKHFPEATDMQKKADDNFMTQGGWTIRGESKDNPNMTFLMLINKL